MFFSDPQMQLKSKCFFPKFSEIAIAFFFETVEEPKSLDGQSCGYAPESPKRTPAGARADVPQNIYANKLLQVTTAIQYQHLYN